jgi:hypothetical protein
VLAWTSPCTSPTPAVAPGISLGRAPGAALGRLRSRAIAARPSSPDHDYYLQLKGRLGANRAALTIARKLLRRAHHTLRELGDAAIAPAS